MIEPHESFDVTAVAGAKGAWRLRFTDDRIIVTSSDAAETLTVERAEVPTKITLMQTFGLRTLYVQDSRRVGFQVDAELVERFERWRGPLTQDHLKAALAQQTRWSLPIAVVWILSSLPMDGDPEAGIEAIPLDHLAIALGSAILLLDIARRIRPDRRIFLGDAVWFLGLSADLVIDAASGRSSHYWLLMLPLTFYFAHAAYKEYRRFEHVAPGRSER